MAQTDNGLVLDVTLSISLLVLNWFNKAHFWGFIIIDLFDGNLEINSVNGTQ